MRFRFVGGGQMTDSFDPDYYAYMVRLWRSEADPFWRVSLEDPHTGERRYFASIQHAFAFIEAQLNQSPGNENPETRFPYMED